MTDGRAGPVETGVWVFYAVFVTLLFIEGGIVHVFGLWIGGALFLVGGVVLGLYELQSIRSEERLRDPILRLGVWMQTHWGVFGYLVNAIFTGGSPGVAVVLKKLDHPRQLSLTLLAAVLFAAVWAPLWYFVW